MRLWQQLGFHSFSDFDPAYTELWLYLFRRGLWVLTPHIKYNLSWPNHLQG